MSSLFHELNEECGVFGIYGADEKMVVELTHLALYAMQHRGRVGAGMAVTDSETIYSYKDLGLVADVFTQPVLKKIKRSDQQLRSAKHTGARRRHVPDFQRRRDNGVCGRTQAREVWLH